MMWQILVYPINLIKGRESYEWPDAKCLYCTLYPHILPKCDLFLSYTQTCSSAICSNLQGPISSAQYPFLTDHNWYCQVDRGSGHLPASRARPIVGICRFLQHRHLAAAGIRLAFCCWLHVSAIPLLLFAQLRAFAFTLSLQIGQGAKIHYPATLRLDFVDVVQCCTYNLYRNLAMN